MAGLWVAILAACSQQTTSSPSAFVGANALVFVDLLDGGALAAPGNEAVNRFLVVTSTNTNELKVLDLRPPSATGVLRGPVQAPNPLETLSIPVLDRPTSLDVDTRYENGVRRKGALLYATRQGGSELSIVGVEPTELREVRRLPLAAPVTAVTNLMPDAQTSRVWIATFDGTNAAVQELTLPGSAAGLRGKRTAELVASLTARLLVRDASIVTMLAVPGLPGRTAGGRPFCADPSRACLALSTRRLGGTEGTSALVDLQTLESVPLGFPGPVRQLLTSDARLPGTGADEGDAAPPPGAVLFGVLDEEACGSFRCGGIAAVDTRRAAGAQGYEVLRAGGVATQSVRWNDGLVRAVAFVAGGRVRSPAVEGGLAGLPVLGIATMSNGDLLFFDALKMSLVDQDPTAASLGPGRFSGGDAWLEGPAISGGTGAEATLRATVKDGAFRSQELRVTWEGLLSPPQGVAVGPGVTATVPLPASLASRVLVGDSVAFSGSGCASSTVTAVSDTSVQVAPAPGCAASAAVVRAGAAAPYVVTGSLDGYLGRAALGATFQSTAPPFLRVPGVDPAAPGLVIPFGRGADTQPPATGVSWTFELNGALTPLVSVVDPGLFQANTTCPTQLQLPGALAIEPVRGRVFAAYPSANVVVEFDAARVGPGGVGPNEGLSCHR